MTRPAPSLGHCMLAGLTAGVAAAALANLTALVLKQQLNQSFDPLNWYLITRATVIASLLGGFFYYALLRWTGWPVLWFAVTGAALAAADVAVFAVHPPEAGLGRLANPVHLVVILAILVLVPTLVPAIPQTERKAPRPSSTPPPIPKQT